MRVAGRPGVGGWGAASAPAPPPRPLLGARPQGPAPSCRHPLRSARASRPQRPAGPVRRPWTAAWAPRWPRVDVVWASECGGPCALRVEGTAGTREAGGVPEENTALLGALCGARAAGRGAGSRPARARHPLPGGGGRARLASQLVSAPLKQAESCDSHQKKVPNTYYFGHFKRRDPSPSGQMRAGGQVALTSRLRARVRRIPRPVRAHGGEGAACTRFSGSSRSGSPSQGAALCGTRRPNYFASLHPDVGRFSPAQTRTLIGSTPLNIRSLDTSLPYF